MLFGHYHFICQIKDDILLPYYKGSTLRGIFGRALKKVLCVLKRQRCSDCFLRQRCIYAIAFETADIPPPFVLELPLTEKRLFSKDEQLDFHLILFGEINKSLPYIIYALKEAGSISAGKKINEKRGSLSLIEVRKDEKIVYSNNVQTIDIKDLYSDLRIPLLRSEDSLIRLKLELITPLRIKFRNRLNAELPFHILIRAVLRRISTLFSHYGEGEPELDYKGLVKRAESVKVLESNIRWFDWRRYSFRQENKMLMGGMIGSVTYEGRLTEFISLIRLCEKLHIGKQTSFGLGKIKIQVLEEKYES